MERQRVLIFIGSFWSGNAITTGERVEVGKGLGDGELDRTLTNSVHS